MIDETKKKQRLYLIAGLVIIGGLLMSFMVSKQPSDDIDNIDGVPLSKNENVDFKVVLDTLDTKKEVLFSSRKTDSIKNINPFDKAKQNPNNELRDKISKLENVSRSEINRSAKIQTELDLWDLSESKESGKSQNNLKIVNTQALEPVLSEEEKLLEKQKAWRKTMEKEKSNFFGSKSKSKPVITEKNDEYILAEISGDIEVTSAKVVRLLILKDVIVKGKAFKKNEFIWAKPKFQKNRVELIVTNINHTPINGIVYDEEDGFKGVKTNVRNFSSEVTSEVIDETARDINTNNNILGSALKNTFRKRKRETSAFLMNGYKVRIKIL